ncbi:MAG: hypothetical protein O4861_08360 [Trichodesmium sp. St16_bin4-tuft]|nr:hypothetical protein [Trichodesmium sp. MAG_R01]MDE5071007.1 hypothetical protein [Trichodesmium sp. St5_bin8]MDE5077106.1 hypothetical protein [Trichodesmium sp. St2_bin6]MDE5092018.1 hypothetical protein [Trichodesmium sp. St18_bin3_1_1]MDE5098345.1 hypothetical protein [Trichodesmium sp. St16_bin4-tuft]MDE5104210.1 hypothetical protein [Trichodesmium sp. St19_bin2]
MIYRCELGNSQEVYVENHRIQTVATLLASSTLGQDQQVNAGFPNRSDMEY